MAENSGIEWTHHTFNPWLGCTKVSPPCDNCYAETWAMRFPANRMLWSGERRRTSAAYWREPLKWDRKAADAGQRHRVFCASLADVFDNQAEEIWRSDLFGLIEETPNLDWLLLTKRPQNIPKMIWPKWEAALPSNIWVGTSVGVRADLRNIEHLRRVRARIRFLSCEPLLEDLGEIDLTGIHLVIAGGESGPKARPSHPDWFRSLRDQCQAAGVPFFFKQWGEWAPDQLLENATKRGLLMQADGTKPTLADAQAIFSGTFDFTEWQHLSMVGKEAAGAMLDGREWREMPGGPR